MPENEETIDEAVAALPTAEGQAEMSDEELLAKMTENYAKAGKISREIADASRKLLMPGEGLLDIAESIEKMILEAGARPAFPANVSLNDIAAHYTPEFEDKALLGEKDLVTIDLGVHVEGCIGDIAYTVDLGSENGKMVEAAEAALAAAVATVRPGKKTGEIGAVIEAEANKFGFKPIENLTGHMLQPYLLHTGIDIPNVKRSGGYEFREGDYFAIEPFVTPGEGRVVDANQIEIFSVDQPRNVRLRQSRQVLVYAIENYFTLPFAERWLRQKFKSKLLLSAALKELVNHGILRPYPVLREASKALVAQAEVTVLVEHDGARIIT